MIVGFYHICTMNHWREVLTEQVDLIQSSGLYDACDRIVVGKVGTEVLPSLPSKFKVSYEGEVTDFEFPTLKLLHTHCKRWGGQVWYIHTKGVSHSRESVAAKRDAWIEGIDYDTLATNLTLWRRFMMHYVVRKWGLCHEALKDHDVCGAAWRKYPPHFSGNFWWARGKYVSKLPPIRKYLSTVGCSSWSTGPRGAAEYWICHGNPKVCNLKRADVNLYLHGASPKYYYPIY